MTTCILLLTFLLIINFKAPCQPAKNDSCYCSTSINFRAPNSKEIEKSGKVVFSIKTDSAGFLGHAIIDSSLCPICDKTALTIVNTIIVQLNACYKKGCYRWAPPNSTMHQVIIFEKTEDDEEPVND